MLHHTSYWRFSNELKGSVISKHHAQMASLNRTVQSSKVCVCLSERVGVACVQEYAAATAEAEMAEAKAVRQGEEAEAFRRIADEKRLQAYQLADKWTG